MANQMAILRKVLRRIRRYWMGLVASLLLATLYVVMSLYIPILVGNAIDCIVDAGRVDFTAMWGYLRNVAICAAVAALAQWLMNQINNHMTYGVTRDIRNEAFRHIQVLPLSYLDKQPQGDVVSRVTADVDTFADGLLMGFTQLFTGVMTILGTLIFMVRIHWGIALVVVCITPLSLLVANFIATRTYSMFKLQSVTRGEQTGLIDETIGNIKVVQAFGHEKASMEQFDEINGRLQKASLRAIFFSSLVNPSTRFVNSVVYAGVGLSGALIAISGGITVGNLTSFLNYANQYTKPFNEISGVVKRAGLRGTGVRADRSPGADAGAGASGTPREGGGRGGNQRPAFLLHAGQAPDRGFQPVRQARPAGRHRRSHGLRKDHVH